MASVKLTQAFIDKHLKCINNKPTEFTDAQLRNGLYVKVTPASPGIGTYYLRYKNNSGKTAHQKIARTTEITLAEARHRAMQLKSEIASGVDLQEQAKQKTVPTLGEFFTQHYAPYAKPRKRSWKKDESMFRLRLSNEFGDVPLSDISRREVQRFHTRLLEVDGLSPATCDHHVKLLQRLCSLAVQWEIMDRNPLSRIPLFKADNQVENYLSEDELRRLLDVLHTDKNKMTCNVMLFLLSTGARLNEALKATWANIDVTNRVWKIPATNSKSKKVRSVPLNQAALDVIASLDTQDNAYLFVNPKTGKRLVSIHTGWQTLRKKAGLPHLRIHDLRHTFASMLVNNGRTLYEVQQILGHSVPIVTQRYSHLSSKTLLSASDAAAEAIARAR
ncbi:integrase [Methylophaga aminisulfidivorans MP]|uniref:Integrase n=1 Tax=Methylophaga aminisulfidivorans MP TaxID=1026882 RepID=F5SZQ2_9GAMM|nr:site-specific integrase [Methylophaga aminisulfidivorans]EGL54479.1 integrase [Methylophaga aminisulfidivorans MP]